MKNVLKMMVFLLIPLLLAGVSCAHRGDKDLEEALNLAGKNRMGKGFAALQRFSSKIGSCQVLDLSHLKI